MNFIIYDTKRFLNQNLMQIAMLFRLVVCEIKVYGQLTCLGCNWTQSLTSHMRSLIFLQESYDNVINVRITLKGVSMGRIIHVIHLRALKRSDISRIPFNAVLVSLLVS